MGLGDNNMLRNMRKLCVFCFAFLGLFGWWIHLDLEILGLRESWE